MVKTWRLRWRGAPRALGFAAAVLAVLAVSFSLALARCQTVDYVSINGDFQSYNVFRRILAGQAPYADFANYIGMAPVVLNLPFLLFNGSFAASLFVTNFTCSVLFSLTVFVVFRQAGGSTPAALLAAAAGTKLLSSGLVSLLGGPAAGTYLTNLYTNLYTPSNSMRIARAFWPFALVLLFLLAAKVFRAKTGRELTLAGAAKSRAFCAALGALCGAGVLWSNDFGIASAIAAAMVLVFLLLRARLGAGGFFARLGIFAAALAAGWFAAALAVTGGHPAAWLRHTAGVAEYQYFYFSGTGGRALLAYIFTNARLLLFTAPSLVFLAVCLVRGVRGRLPDGMVLLAFLDLCVLGATYAYILSGSGYSFTEALEGYTLLAGAAFLCRGALWLLRRAQRLWRAAVAAGCAALLLCGLALPALAMRAAAAPAAPPVGAVTVEALGGPTTMPLALVEAAALTGDEPVFSVYATGLEVVKGQFQPTGYDYIIHALGPGAQAAYEEVFTAGDWPWVQTPSFGLEGWLSVENWYFYRHVLAGYEKQMRTEYSWLWRKSGDRRLDIDTRVRLEQQGGAWTVVVTGPPGADFTADVQIAYSTSFTSGWGAAVSLGRKAVWLSCPGLYTDIGGTGAAIPAEAGVWHIPVGVRGGVGTATLTPADAGCVALQVERAEVVWCLPPLWLNEPLILQRI